MIVLPTIILVIAALAGFAVFIWLLSVLATVIDLFVEWLS